MTPATRPFVLALACGVSAACVAPKRAAPPMPSCADDEVRDGVACAPAACGAGRWGSLPVDDATIHVDAGAPEDGDGTEATPFREIQPAADLARERDGGLVAIARGLYVENVELGDGSKDIQIRGRCPELVTLDGSGRLQRSRSSATARSRR